VTVPTISIWLPWILRLLALAGVLVLLLRGYRSIARMSTPAGRVVAVGLAGRAFLACGLFLVSYFDLPLLESLHSGDGFWDLAPDARLYYRIALPGVEHGFWTIPARAPSPAFIATLSAWMWLVGVSPASGALLNLACYVLTCFLLVRILARDRTAALVGVAAFTFSPSLVFFGSQSLKDGFFAAVVACLCAGAWRLLGSRSKAAPARALTAASFVILAGLYLVAGIRTYYALFLWGALTVALAGWAIAAGRSGLSRKLALTVLVAGLGWFAVSLGAGIPYDKLVTQIVAPPKSVSSRAPVRIDAVDALDRARLGFISSGGSTNVGGPRKVRGPMARLRALGSGCLLVFVPVTVLDAFGLVRFSGGRGLIALADLDTAFVDLTLAAVLVVAWRRWRAGRLTLPYALFIVLVAVPTALALAYVVTNFGTLFRLRLMVSVPAWMLMLSAVRPRGDEAPAPAGGVACA
jgi:hypothetical protein